MTLSSVLVVGAEDGSAAAVALARRGIEVALIAPTRMPLDDLVAVRDLGVEVRLGIDLVGIVDVDDYVEAELSTGRVENFDAVLVTDQTTAARLHLDGAHLPRVGVVRDAADTARWASRLDGRPA